MIKFRCTSCDKKIGVQEEYSGRRVRCPNCSSVTVIPGTEWNGSNMHDCKERTQYSVFICHESE